jgi:hypothetical protein
MKWPGEIRTDVVAVDDEELETVTGLFSWEHPCESVDGGKVVSHQVRVRKEDGAVQLYCAGCNDGSGWFPLHAV